MGRPRRESLGGMVYHVLNRGVGRRTLFETADDYRALERIVDETLRLRPMRICAYCLMPNHWHFVLWPEEDGDRSRFVQQFTNTHVKRWKQHFHETGLGHLYQGRFKSFPVPSDDYFYQVVRYVERNALRSNPVETAEQWPSSSLGLRNRREDSQSMPFLAKSVLAQWPLPRPANWLYIVNQPQTDAELAALRRCVKRGCPFGDPQWAIETADKLGLNSTLRARGRGKKEA